jgi:hypothetical protein
LDGPSGPADQPGRTSLAPPPAIVTPWGTRALGEYFRRAERYDIGPRGPAEAEWRLTD